MNRIWPNQALERGLAGFKITNVKLEKAEVQSNLSASVAVTQT
jgi:hypothetical protein